MDPTERLNRLLRTYALVRPTNKDNDQIICDLWDLTTWAERRGKRPLVTPHGKNLFYIPPRSPNA
jgi:hypothetical protein